MTSVLKEKQKLNPYGGRSVCALTIFFPSILRHRKALFCPRVF